MKKLLQISITISLLWIHNVALSQAISWLSKPQHDMGLVVNADIKYHTLSANGRYVTFLSEAGNLVPGDDNYGEDVFIKDLINGEIKRVTELSNGTGMNASNIFSFSSASDDGRYVSFISNADNLPMANGDYILYLKDLDTGSLVADSVDAGGQTVYNVKTFFSGFEQSKDGRYVAFTSSDNIVNNPQLTQNVFRKDRQTNTYQLVSVDHNGAAAGGALLEDMSANGRYITFRSDQEILPGHPNPVAQHNYLRDMSFSNTVLFHQDINNQAVVGDYLNSRVSDTGKVVFCSLSDNLVPGDNNLLSDVFVYHNGTTNRISLTQGQQQITDSGCYSAFIKQHVDISGDGEKIVFLHASNQLTTEDNGDRLQAYAYHVASNQSQLISKNSQAQSANQDVVNIGLNGDGSRISLLTAATTFNQNQANHIYKNIFIYSQNNNQLNALNLATVTVNHLLADALAPVLTADSTEVVYSSKAPNADSASMINSHHDLFIYNRSNHIQSLLANQVKANHHDMSDNGRYIVFVSDRFQPVSTIELDGEYVFLYDRQTDQYSQIAIGHSPKVSDDGQVVFVSNDDTLSAQDNNGVDDIYIYNNSSQQLSLVSAGQNNAAANGISYDVDIGGQGIATWIVFLSFADNLIAHDDTPSINDIFMVNWPQGVIQRVTETDLSKGQNGNALNVSISSNSQYIAFASYAQNLVNDNYPFNSIQVFVFDRNSNDFSLISFNDFGDPHEGNTFTETIGLSETGRFISYSTNGYFGFDADQNAHGSVYLYDQLTQTNLRISQHLNGDDLTLGSYYGFVQANETVTPPLVSVVFSERGELLNPRPNTAYQQVMLYQQGGEGVDLTMQITGDGYVSGNLGYTCQTNCVNTYDLGTTLHLLAIEDSGANFVGWLGEDCPPNSPNCTVVMNEPKTIQAIFSQNDVIFKHGFE